MTPNSIAVLARLKAPILKIHSMTIKITRFFTDVDGIILAKNTVPAALQVRYPFYMFGKFDRSGGYKAGLNLVQPVGGTFYLTSFVVGVGYQFLQGNGFNNIYGQLKTGDIVHIYTDSLLNPAYYVWIVQNNPAASLASIIDNSETTQIDGRLERLFIYEFLYKQDSALDVQWQEPITYVRFDNLGNVASDSINPFMFKTPDTEQTGFLRIATKFWMDQYLGIYSVMRFETDSIALTFNINKITPQNN